MIQIDVDEIAEVNYQGEESVTIRFKDGTERTYRGADLPEVLEILKHWTPPTA